MNKRLYMQKKPTWQQELAAEVEALETADKQIQPQPRPRINQYTCTSCGGVITTVDRDSGVTPFMLACRAMDGCYGTMHSHLYRVAPGLTPDHEWYKPTSLKGLTPGMRDHVEMGGLLIRKIESEDAS